jgi:hypothetical protein
MIPPPAKPASAQPPLARDVWLAELQVMVARDRAGTADGFFLAAKGGHNEESHNHNDVGTLLAYLDGWPLLIDVGVETYTAKTFGPDRYDIWTMQSQWHNLPTVNGDIQRNGRAFTARDVHYSSTDEAATLQLDLAAAWPASAAIARWTRTISLQRGTAIVITDDYELTAARQPTVFNFITTRPIDLSTPGQVRLGAFPEAPSSRGAVLAYDAAALTAEVDIVEVTDPMLRKSWERIFRIRLTERTATAQARREFRLTAAP